MFDTSPEPPPATLPPRSALTIPGVGETTIRLQLLADRVPLVLLHGWGITCDFNFCHLLEPAAARHGVVAMDLRGHGRGLPVLTDQRFSVSQCADDVVALLDVLHVARAMVCGYSLGAPVALQLAARHSDRIAALILQAPSVDLDSVVDRVLQQVLRAIRPLARRSHGIGKSAPLHYFRRFGRRDQQTARWWPWLQGELCLCDPLVLVDAFLDEYEFDVTPMVPVLRSVPTAVVVTTRDSSVAPASQRALAGRLGATVIELDANHDVFLTEPTAYVESTLRAIDAVNRCSPP